MRAPMPFLLLCLAAAACGPTTLPDPPLPDRTLAPSEGPDVAVGVAVPRPSIAVSASADPAATGGPRPSATPTATATAT
ncbi:MAG: hypothetical protein JWM80_133, partial [Cyanobacteria bacterium RYN_339]|nr:hypothetical protein [Cyanobacteria bacterium RYN_339]